MNWKTIAIAFAVAMVALGGIVSAVDYTPATVSVSATNPTVVEVTATAVGALSGSGFGPYTSADKTFTINTNDASAKWDLSAYGVLKLNGDGASAPALTLKSAAFSVDATNPIAIGVDSGHATLVDQGTNAQGAAGVVYSETFTASNAAGSYSGSVVWTVAAGSF